METATVSADVATKDADAAITVVSGLSFCFSSAVETAMDAATASAVDANPFYSKKRGLISSPLRL